MSKIKILGQTNLPGTHLLDDMLRRNATVTVLMPPGQPPQNRDQSIGRFYQLLRREAEQEPMKLTQVLRWVDRSTISWSPASCTATVSLTYRQQEDPYYRDLEYVALCATEQDLCEYLRDAMLLRKRTILLLQPYTGYQIPQDVNYLLRVEEIHKQGAYNDQRYLERHIVRTQRGRSLKLGFLAHLFRLEYGTTYEQEQILYRAVDQTIDQMRLREQSTYDKIRMVYGYIVGNTRYDYQYQRYTAYHAMIEHCACCQGYALLFYLFMRKLDVPVEYIRGETDNGEHHGWNLVKFGAFWYNIDTTWEQLQRGRNITVIRQNYLLKCDADFRDHTPNPYYQTEAFRAAHPLAKKSV